MSQNNILHLFAGYGIELEYMIVDEETLVPLPICDKVLMDLAGEKTMSVTRGEIGWSNELALHVIELKSNGPKADLAKLHSDMHEAVLAMNDHLTQYGAILLPSAMHPFFNPNDGSLKLWDSEDAEIYAAYNRIFGCRGHGWGNLQSIHINLPFCGDEEFERLHSAIRLVLPLLPALAASSPYVEGKRGPLHDSRLSFYLDNQRRIPSIIGDAIPEPVGTRAEYQKIILDPMYRDIASHDPEGVLQHEWLNSRAAIARFDRNAIEIRILDIQECLLADFSLIAAITTVIKSLASNGQTTKQRLIRQSVLKDILQGALQHGTDFEIECNDYLGALQSDGTTIGGICGGWLDSTSKYYDSFSLLSSGHNLATRLINRCGELPSAATLKTEYRALSSCLLDDRQYDK